MIEGYSNTTCDYKHCTSAKPDRRNLDLLDFSITWSINIINTWSILTVAGCERLQLAVAAFQNKPWLHPRDWSCPSRPMTSPQNRGQLTQRGQISQVYVSITCIIIYLRWASRLQVSDESHASHIMHISNAMATNLARITSITSIRCICMHCKWHKYHTHLQYQMYQEHLKNHEYHD